ncbi:MAG: hypothetical protein ABI358_12215, partial [Ginsengibacter sp.]
MFSRITAFIIFFSLLYGRSLLVSAQVETAAEAAIEKATPLFHSDDILHLKLTGNLNALFKDISDNNSYHPVLLQYTQS